jgi:hypothetical protein
MNATVSPTFLLGGGMEIDLLLSYIRSEEGVRMTGAKARIVFLGVLLVVVLGVGFAIGLTIRPGEWYASLSKPFFTPPNR